MLSRRKDLDKDKRKSKLATKFWAQVQLFF